MESQPTTKGVSVNAHRSLTLSSTVCIVVAVMATLTAATAKAGDHAKALKYVEEGNAQFDKGVQEANAKTGEQVKYFREAISQYESAMAEAPDLVEPYFNKGLAIIWLNRCSSDTPEGLRAVSQAESCFNKVLELSPDSAEALYGIAQANFEIICHAFAQQHHPAGYENAKSKALSAIADLQKRFPASQAAKQANSLKADIDYHDKTNLVKAIREDRQFQPIYPRWGTN